jgi:exodeoxyribonuclease V gamma subunit
MLETLLCARQVLYLSYCGRSLKDNSECQPSVLVRELLDFIDGYHGDNSASQQRFSISLTTWHPMQAFAAKNYFPHAASYDSYWCRIANRIHQAPESTEAQIWATGHIADNDEKNRNIDLNELRRFLQNPIKFFFNRRLKLWLTSHQESEDEETFSLDALEKWGIKQHIANDLMLGRETSTQELQAQGRLPHGYAAYAGLQTIQSEIEPLLLPLQDYRGTTLQTRSVDCQLDDQLRLNGQVGNYFAGKGLMLFSSSSLKGKHLLSLWLDHLALCASEQLKQDESSLLITRDTSLRFEYLDAQMACDQLMDYCELYYLGLSYPLPVFPQASYAWCRESNPEKAMSEAQKAWRGNSYTKIPADIDDAYAKLTLRRNLQEPLTSDEFRILAERLYANALNHAIEYE